MARHFSTILIPVDFSLNTDVAVSKALEITRHSEECSIHLFHVQRIVLPGVVKQIHYLFKGYSRRQVNTSIEKSNHQLSKLKSVIEGIRKDINVFTWVSFGDPVEQAIINKAARLAADLIIIGKRSHQDRLNGLNSRTAQFETTTRCSKANIQSFSKRQTGMQRLTLQRPSNLCTTL